MPIVVSIPYMGEEPLGVGDAPPADETSISFDFSNENSSLTLGLMI